jgi:hypothetical protein
MDQLRVEDRPAVSIARRLAATYTRLDDVVVHYKRGFPQSIACTPRTLLEHGDDLLSVAPILHVSVSDRLLRAKELDKQMRELASCPSLRRLYSLSLTSGQISTDTFIEFAKSPHLRRMIRFNLPTSDDQPSQIKAAWTALVESDACRRMVNWNRFTKNDGVSSWEWRTTITAPGEVGDVMCEEVNGGMAITTTYEPMNEASRALEQRFGYIPALHATNWSAGVLDVLQGRKPKFAAGAAPTEAMYAVPPEYAERGSGY